MSLGFSVVGVFKHVFGMFFFSLHVTSAVSFCFSIHVSVVFFQLFHLEGYWVRLNDQPVSGMLSHFESQQEFYFQRA